jgi:hypothetical protein
MKDADTWVLNELRGLQFGPYIESLSQLERSFSKFREIESQFAEKIADSTTKRQAVALGLLARAYQLGISCLMNQLQQNFAGWHCSYRALLETLFVVEWIAQDPQRFEAYFEGTAPGMGRIKADFCGRHPEFADLYASASEVTHVGSRSLHLSRKLQITTTDAMPFTATSMLIAGPELAEMLRELTELLVLLAQSLELLLIQNFDLTTKGEVLWAKGAVRSKFGCLGWERAT